MSLILSCLTNHPEQTRRILDRLCAIGWSASDITVLHPDAPELATTQSTPDGNVQAAMVAGGSGALVAGAFGWLVGYGVLALPSALFGAALGAAAGAAIGVGSDEEAALRRSMLAHYGPRINGTRSAILVTADDARSCDLVLSIFRSEEAEDIQVLGKGRLEVAGERESH